MTEEERTQHEERTQAGRERAARRRDGAKLPHGRVRGVAQPKASTRGFRTDKTALGKGKTE